VKDGFGKARTFVAANANANRLARMLRAAGVTASEAVAMMCSNSLSMRQEGRV
jgi:hypothetical protein